jgi:hypothetical protein
VNEKGVVMPYRNECRAWVPDEKGKSGQCRRKAPTKVYSGTEYVGVGLKMKSYEGVVDQLPPRDPGRVGTSTGHQWGLRDPRRE